MCAQITALIFLPSFPGWLAPLAFNPVRFLEFFSFTATLLGTWVAAGEGFQWLVSAFNGCCVTEQLRERRWQQMRQPRLFPLWLFLLAGMLSGGYRYAATADVQTAL